MAGAKTASSKKTSGARVRKLGEKFVTPVLYYGRAVGHGKYLAGSVDGQLVCDDSGKPFQFREVGELVLA